MKHSTDWEFSKRGMENFREEAERAGKWLTGDDFVELAGRIQKNEYTNDESCNSWTRMDNRSRNNNRFSEARKAELRQQIRMEEEARVRAEKERVEREKQKALENTVTNFPTLSNAPTKTTARVEFEGGNFAQKAAEWKENEELKKKLAQREEAMPAQTFYVTRPKYKKKSSRIDFMNDDFDVAVYREEEETSSAPVDDEESGWTTVETAKARVNKPRFGGQIQMSLTVQARIQKRKEILQRLERGEVLTWQDRKTLEEPIEDDEEFNADLVATTKKNKNDERSKKNDIATA